jgi:KaiC/GvpD/RAD55 family RecA-like ATPase
MANRIRTGIPGFDEIINGGFIPRSVNLLSGGAGTGKTIFALQYLFNGARMFNERCMYISFEEDIDEVKSDVEEFGFNFDEVSELVKFIYIAPYGLTSFLPALQEELTNFSPQRIVIDSLSSLASVTENSFERRKEIFQLIKVLKAMNCTAILTSENPGDGHSSLSRFGVEEFLCDSLILINLENLGGDYSRSMIVRKMRKTKHSEDVHPMEISETGIKIHKLE